ncbi:MAG TPA: VOC family protein [Trueperaceae bacterium]|nr:VOC family protein [Trueperaceae bacterium]
MRAGLNRIIIYAKDMQKMASFYEKHFFFRAKHLSTEKEIESNPINGGIQIRILQAAKGAKRGQVIMKLVFDVEDVESFVNKAKVNGLDFKIHKANGYLYASTKDPENNNIQVSARAYRNNI